MIGVTSFNPLARVNHNLSATAFFAVMAAFNAAPEAFFAVGLKLLPRFPHSDISRNAATVAFFAAIQLTGRVQKSSEIRMSLSPIRHKTAAVGHYSTNRIQHNDITTSKTI